MVASYIPQVNDVAWLDFLPQARYEHAGRRPNLVLCSA